MKKHNLTFEFPDEESKNKFIGWFLDGGGEQSESLDGLGFSLTNKNTIVVEKFEEDEACILKPNNICEDCGKKASFGDDPSKGWSDDEEDGAWLCNKCYDVRDKKYRDKQLQHLRDGKISQKK